MPRNRASTITGDTLRRLRLKAGLTTGDLAEMMDVHAVTVRAVESTKPASKPLVRLYLLCVAPEGEAHVRAALDHASSLAVLQAELGQVCHDP